MKYLWWKLSVDWPCAAHRWLWIHLAKPLLEQLSFRRMIFLAAVTLLVIGAAQIGFAPSEFTFLWAGDTAFYFEIASAVMFLAVRGHVGQMVRIIGHRLRLAAGRMKRFGGMGRQSRRRRKNGASRPKLSGDEPATGGVYACA
jgi:hypothetical protein